MNASRAVKAARYGRIREQLASVLDNCDDPICRMATTVAFLHHKQPYFFWTGFYRYLGGQLVVGPYQGPPACQTIALGRGVCGTAYARRETVVVPDVHQFPDHIACDDRSRSEIVVPYTSSDGLKRGVLDVDSTRLAAFDDTDAEELEKVLALVFRSNVTA